ncbi:hypothetical protein [Ekhidna sp.]|uniref:hypothetical protein n=1 Tax=Ekhidna sp. TaxID=2608089 RepID=UPI003299095E
MNTDKSTDSLKLKPKYIGVFDDVTAEKTSRIEKLKRLVEDAKKELAQAQAAYESFQEKSALFQQLLSKAESKLTVATTQDNLAVEASQKVESMQQTAKAATATADDTYADTQKLLDNVQQVVEATLKASTQITITAEFIMNRKFSNPLVSSQLVTDSAQAATDANKAVSLIINTLTSTFNALSASNQAKNTAGIVEVEIEYLTQALVSSLENLANNKVNTIEDITQANYEEARSLEKEAQTALDEVNKATIRAKNEMTRAAANLANTEAALNAAEAAAGS